MEGASINDPQLLTEILDIQEELERKPSLEKLKSLNETNQKKLEVLFRNIGILIEDGKYEEAKKEIIQVQYFENIGLQLKRCFQ